MSSPRMREEFEAFAGTHPMLSQYGFDRFPVGGKEYDAISLQGAWAAWQASREAVMVELPDYLDTEKLGFPAYDAAAVDAAIEAAGLKVAP